jgi:hypothetical protein
MNISTRNMLSCYFAILTLNGLLGIPSEPKKRDCGFPAVHIIPVFALQDYTVASSFLFTVLVANRKFNRELKHFIDSVVLFGRTLNILCSHRLSHRVSLSIRPPCLSRWANTSWKVMGAWPWVRRILIARALCRRSDFRPTRRTGVFGQKCLTSGYH